MEEERNSQSDDLDAEVDMDLYIRDDNDHYIATCRTDISFFDRCTDDVNKRLWILERGLKEFFPLEDHHVINAIISAYGNGKRQIVFPRSVIAQTGHPCLPRKKVTMGKNFLVRLVERGLVGEPVKRSISTDTGPENCICAVICPFEDAMEIWGNLKKERIMIHIERVAKEKTRQHKKYLASRERKRTRK